MKPCHVRGSHDDIYYAHISSFPLDRSLSVSLSLSLSLSRSLLLSPLPPLSLSHSISHPITLPLSSCLHLSVSQSHFSLVRHLSVMWAPARGRRGGQGPRARTAH